MTIRLIPRLDIKGPNLIKGIRLEGLRKLGNPHEFARRYYESGADELLYMDIVASLYERDKLLDIVRNTASEVFIPLTVGGGIRSDEDANDLLKAGADKVAINTAAVHDPGLITRVARRFGSQCMVISIEAKRLWDGRWEVYTDNGRQRTGLDVLEWAKKAEGLGAGEVLLTSVDQEGTRQGFDLELTRAVSDRVSIPVIASGGMGCLDHLIEVIEKGRADAVAMADVLHYNRLELNEMREALLARGLPVRTI
ncbi:MAG: imidazole glycerol phosphate synthase subunit HisF [Chitinophagales bacterium]